MKIKIGKVEKRTSNSGKDYYIVFFDGKSGLSWDAEFMNKIGQEVEADVEEKEENGQKKISIKLPKVKGGFAPKGKSEKELGMEFRAKSLECAIESAKLANLTADKATSVNMINVAKTYFKYIETGE